MSDRSKALALLREFTIEKKEIIWNKEKNELCFDKYNVPIALETPLCAKQKNTPYTVGALWFMLKYQASSHADYLKKCTEEKFPQVSYLDRNEMIEYLTGKADTAPQIQKDEPALKKSKVELDKIDEPAPKKLILSLDDVLAREKQLATRNSCLQTKSKPFRGIIEVVQKTVSNEEKKKKEAASKHQKTQYNRYETQEGMYWKDKGMSDLQDFGLDTRGTFDPTLKADSIPSSSSSKANNNNNNNNNTNNNNSQSTGSSSSSSDAKKRPEQKKGEMDKSRVPIIVVPAALSALLTQHNAVEFLVDGKFVSSLEKREQNTLKEQLLSFTRTRNGKGLKYQITDNPTKLDKRDWARIVGVFVHGPAWQFKNWLWKTPVEIFAACPGFFICFEDEATPDTVKSWNVKKLVISKQTSKRHLAQTQQLFFWRHIDEFIKLKRSTIFHEDYWN